MPGWRLDPGEDGWEAPNRDISNILPTLQQLGQDGERKENVYSSFVQPDFFVEIFFMAFLLNTLRNCRCTFYWPGG